MFATARQARWVRWLVASGICFGAFFVYAIHALLPYVFAYENMLQPSDIFGALAFGIAGTASMLSAASLWRRNRAASTSH